MRKSGRRRHVLVAQQFLDRADVLASLQQMRGKRMAQRVACGGFEDARALPRRLDRALQPRLVHVMATLRAVARVHAARRRGKHVLPAPLRRSARKLARQRVRHPGPAEAGRQIPLVDSLRLRQLRPQWLGQRTWQHGATIFRPLALAHQNFVTFEIHVLHAHAHALHQPHPGAVQQAPHQPRQARQFAQQRRHLRSGQHHRQTLRPPRPLDPVQPRQLDAQHLFVKEQQRRQGLVLRSRSDMGMHRQRGEETLDLRRTESGRVALVVGQDKTANPADISVLTAPGHAQPPHPVAHLVEQLRRRCRRCPIRPFPRVAKGSHPCPQSAIDGEIRLPD